MSTRFDRYSIDGIHPPTHREPLEFPVRQMDGPQFFHGLLAVIVLAAPVVATILILVALTQWRFFGGGVS